eukprot:1141510-Pelagomonas_calceolata.AAC.3
MSDFTAGGAKTPPYANQYANSHATAKPSRKTTWLELAQKEENHFKLGRTSIPIPIKEKEACSSGKGKEKLRKR